MSESYLRLRFGNEGERWGELFARAQADGFSGEGSGYFDIDEIEKFALAVGAFPLKMSSISGGFEKRDSAGKLEEHLGISLYAIDSRGHIRVQVRMSTTADPGDTRSESQNSAKVELVTTYEPLSKFSRGLIALVRGSVAEIRLDGEDSKYISSFQKLAEDL
jgi:hypothetical protein